ncbi:MAG: Uma2 family endonuclease [Isosphaeraceae bacterium]|nr:Uma2 family endonuclease [Isosphaeraceae bacterium]
MSTQTVPPAAPSRMTVVYPDTDGQPMAENTLQFEWIVTIKEGMERAFRDDPNVFVAGDLFWYPVEGNNKVRMAPDVMVVVGRPKGHRGSYMQWLEGGIAPQVVFEILSPSNRPQEMTRKTLFYEHFGINEYYQYDPDDNDLSGWQREGLRLVEIPKMNGWVSPSLGIRFELEADKLRLIGPDGRPFATYAELAHERDEIAHERDEIARERDEIARERDAERLRTERLIEQLRALGAEPEL